MADNLLQGLQAAANATSQTGLKNSPDGWKLCCDALIRNLYRHVSSNLVDQQALREILLTWLRNQCCTESDNKNFLKNKAAQVFSLIFVCDYPEKWPLFFSDLLQCLQYGALAVDMYLRILKAIDEEVVDRDVIRSQQEVERNTKIKDHIRDMCITEPVDSWFQILVLLTDTICTNKCNMKNALFEEATQHEKRNVSERNGGVKLA
ncbi:exportin-T-like [Porites lutea]|uniref:exportin-T-like n=1 Tax=Porites lutea TaxID=51062 RepID=UPI003CC5441C